MKTALLLLLPVLACAAPDPLPPLNFSDSSALQHLQPNQSTCSWIAPGGVKIAFQKASWPNVMFTAGRGYASADWSHAGALAIEVRNPGEAPLDVHVRVDEGPRPDGPARHRTGRATVAPGERTTLLIPLETNAPDMRAGPPFELPGAFRRCESGGQVDPANIVAFQIFLARPERPLELDLYGIRWLPKMDLGGIVDRFGQYSRSEWPGKIHDEDELAQARTGEREWLQAHPAPADRDEYGGWKDGPQLKASGFFRTEQVDGRWWLVTPGGRLFWSIGVDCVRKDERCPLRGRDAMFTWLPDGAAKSGWVDFYQTNLRRKYGESWESEWGRLVSERLPAWGFNTVANWSDPQVFRLRRVPYTATVHVGGMPPIGPEPEKGTHDRRLPDFFDPAFPGKADASIAKAVAEWRDDPWCIGYFVDNELSWDSWAQGGTGGEYKVAREVLAAPAKLAARMHFTNTLREKYGSIEAFTKAWKVQATTWENPIDLAGAPLSEEAREDCSAFLTSMAERYFSVVSAALKKHAPRQLYLGCRFAVRPREVVSVSVKYCDVVSFNIYHDVLEPEKWGFANELGKPVIIGEFHFGALDRGMFHGGLRPKESQAARGQAYARYVESVLAMPAFVGCHWFQYSDQPLLGRFDGENYNIGLVTITDSPHPELRDAAREVNSRIYSLRTAASR